MYPTPPFTCSIVSVAHQVKLQVLYFICSMEYNWWAFAQQVQTWISQKHLKTLTYANNTLTSNNKTNMSTSHNNICMIQLWFIMNPFMINLNLNFLSSLTYVSLCTYQKYKHSPSRIAEGWLSIYPHPFGRLIIITFKHISSPLREVNNYKFLNIYPHPFGRLVRHFTYVFLPCGLTLVSMLYDVTIL